MSRAISQETNNTSPTLDWIKSESSSKGREEHQLPSNGSLSVPPNRTLRRSSVESAFSGSDISELSFGSTELGGPHNEGLLPVLSNATSSLAHVPAPSAWRSWLQEFWIANYGAFLVLMSQVFGCMMNIATRVLETPGSHGAPMHPFQILFVRQFVTTLITSTYAFWSRSIPHFPLGPPIARVRLLLVARGLAGFFGVMGLYFSLLYLPISEATVLTFLGPIGTCYAFSLLLPGETFSRQQQLAGFISLIGVIFIARPFSMFKGDDSNNDVPDTEVASPINGTSPADETNAYVVTSAQHLQAVGVAMIGVAGAIVALTAIRAIGSRAHALISVNYFSAWCTIASLVALLIFPDVKFRLPGNLLEWGLLSILGCCGFVLQLLLTQGLAYGASASASNDNTTTQSPHTDIEMQGRGSLVLAEDRTMSNSPGPRPTEPAGSNDHATKGQPIKGSGAKATSMLYTQMLFALIADRVIFSITPSLWSWIGSGLILAGAIWVAADGSRKTKSDDALPVSSRSGQSSMRSKPSNIEHEEEVGLLADVDELDQSQANQAPQTSTNSRLNHG